jgi:hypothetical protein
MHLTKIQIAGIAFFIFVSTNAQSLSSFDGQLMGQGGIGFEKGSAHYMGTRYLPEFTLKKKIDSLHALAVEISGNLNASQILNGSKKESTTDFSPYRIWIRYQLKKWEFRLGLQKIDFGVAQLLRPLQWFNQIDPRDPLGLTNGVYGLLVRHYFKNNSNLWLWGLYGNDKTRGFDAFPSIKKHPEFGGRFQKLVPKGEIAISYHYRKAGQNPLFEINPFSQNPEHRIGWDSKWDLGIGLWTESSFIHRTLDIGPFTNQFLFNLGMDYTFGIGNGITLSSEHLFSSTLNRRLTESINLNTSALSINYPLSFYSSLNGFVYNQWENNQQTWVINYQYEFRYFSSYVILYYNPEENQGIQQNEIFTNLTGPGIQLLLVYNH